MKGTKMEELIKQVTAKAGISEDQARTAVTTVLGFLKTKFAGADCRTD
jgi:nucleoid DNA-binding protein